MSVRAYTGEDLRTVLREHDQVALDNWKFRWPLLQQPWRGPDWVELGEPGRGLKSPQRAGSSSGERLLRRSPRVS